MGIALWDNLKAQPDAARAVDNYRLLAAGYDVTCTRIVSLRQRAVRELNLLRGETVLDIACGTGPTLPDLASAVGPTGRVIGVELSPEMAASARRRVDALGLSESVQILESAVESMQVSQRADALLLCYTHDVLQSPQAIERMILSAKPGARLVIVGMKTLPWLWGWPANLFNLYRARRYLTTFRNLRRPWQLIEERGAVLRVVHSALWGSAYIAVGTLADIQLMKSPAPVLTPFLHPAPGGITKGKSMKQLNSLFKGAVLAAALVSSGLAIAHKDEDHSKKAGPVKKEQKDWGIAGDAKAGIRTIEFKMTDTMRFTPDKLEVKQGETVKFVLKNNGAVMHEFVLGTKKELDEHAALMVKFPTMEHSEPYMAHVGPGKTGEIVWTFNRAGDFDFACLIAGHYQAGMVGKIKVVASAVAKADVKTSHKN